MHGPLFLFLYYNRFSSFQSNNICSRTAIIISQLSRSCTSSHNPRDKDYVCHLYLLFFCVTWIARNQKLVQRWRRIETISRNSIAINRETAECDCIQPCSSWKSKGNIHAEFSAQCKRLNLGLKAVRSDSRGQSSPLRRNCETQI